MCPAGTVAFGAAINGGFWPLVTPPASVLRARTLHLIGPGRIPHSFLDRLLGIPPGGLGDWLLAQGTLVALIIAVAVIMLASSPVNRRVLFLLAVPFVLESGIYVTSLVSPPLPAALGNTIASLPLFVLLLVAIASTATASRSPAA